MLNVKMNQTLKALRRMAFLFSAFIASSIPAPAADNWKGQTTVRPLELGLMGGAAIYGNQVNWGVLPSVAYLLRDRAFVQDIDDRVWSELQLGPTFFNTPNSNETGLQYSAHLRWDFSYNEVWTFYGLGGLSGFFLPARLGGSFTIHPRFGTGVQYQTKTALILRGEVSAEFIGMGASFNF
jgi:hypothetical protein